MSVLFVDIDHFKQYNDTYGHQAGDKVLISVAGAIARSIKRPQDIAARFGGEEFVIILPDTALHGAQEVAGRIQSAVAGLQIEHLHSAFTRLTVSIGCACSQELQETEQPDLMQAADRALYQAKTAGRNQVMAYQM
ncbi:diguanylate cyclase [Paludibacterium denitrificans]|uniref:diguanylate cyclase n=1 Tax=Paludibacterium denitrificans TaxID=2675226 RepID=A0A844GCE1_9NEIS|nr:diguanylate cyclase [Paludibacterium denitrificans]MTD34216.1 diguanylate cyclase [Paludibacterium denitrificans]